MKRFIDIVLAAAGLVMVAPLLAIAGMWIKLDSRGPMLYRGWRAGRFGKPFLILKLRTMVHNAEALGGSETATNDPRITHAGTFLRRYKLDELPQLVNVLVGDMSVVGPRPEVLEEVVHYSDTEKEVLQVRPGLTDWASLRFHHEGDLLVGSTDVHRTYHEIIRPEKIRLQLQYVRTNSVLSDFRIMLQTVRVIFH